MRVVQNIGGGNRYWAPTQISAELGPRAPTDRRQWRSQEFSTEDESICSFSFYPHKIPCSADLSNTVGLH